MKLVLKEYKTLDPNKGYFSEDALISTKDSTWIQMEMFEDVLESRGYTFDCGPHTNMERHWYKKKGDLYKGWAFVIEM